MASSKSSAKQLSGPGQVAAFLAGLDHPFKKEIEVLRHIILGANPGLTEHIKWNAPSFCFNGEDRITFNLQGKGMFRLIFHCGAKVKNAKSTGTLFEDKTGLLEWLASDRAVVVFTSMEDIRSREPAITETVNSWIEAAG